MSTLSSFRSYSRVRIPEINSTDALSDANFLILLNRVQQEFIKLIEGYPTSTVFASVASQQTYNLRTYVPTYLGVRDLGLWHQASATASKVQLISTTIADMSRRMPNWRNASAGTPRYVVIDGDDLLVHPKPAAANAYASGFELYHFAQTTDLSNDSHYLFTGSLTTELKFLIPHEDILIDGLKYMVYSMIGKPNESAASGSIFVQRCQQARIDIRKRPDLKKDYRPQLTLTTERSMDLLRDGPRY